jgi:hypothetical protein
MTLRDPRSGGGSNFPADAPTLDQIEYGEDIDLLDCTYCSGEGTCWDGDDLLGSCPDEPHRCHACGGSGKRRDQVIF